LCVDQQRRQVAQMDPVKEQVPFVSGYTPMGAGSVRLMVASDAGLLVDFI